MYLPSLLNELWTVFRWDNQWWQIWKCINHVMHNYKRRLMLTINPLMPIVHKRSIQLSWQKFAALKLICHNLFKMRHLYEPHFMNDSAWMGYSNGLKWTLLSVGGKNIKFLDFCPKMVKRDLPSWFPSWEV